MGETTVADHKACLLTKCMSSLVSYYRNPRREDRERGYGPRKQEVIPTWCEDLWKSPQRQNG